MADRNEHNSLYENSEYPSRRQAPGGGNHQARKKKKKRGHPIIAGFFKMLGTVLLIGLCTGAVLLCFAVVYIQTVIVPIADLSMDDFQFGENSVMLYQNPETGNYDELVTLASSTSATWSNWDEIPQYLKDAAVAIEDKRFYEHPGVDWKRTGKAVLSMFTGDDISGGSTITQQLIKNLTHYNETTVKRKVTEIVRALRFTQNHSKDDTLLWYLNIIPLGSGCEGVGAASYEYFGKPVSQLTLAECASLIGITNNPSRYSPYSTAHSLSPDKTETWGGVEWNKYRQEVVLYQMLDQGKISQSEYDTAVAQELVFTKGADENAPDDSTVYSWYEETVLSDVREDLKERLGWSDKRITQALELGGLRIYTCLNPSVQAIAEEIYTNRAYLNYTSPNGQKLQSSITIIDNSNNTVAAIVGQFDAKTGNLWTNYANTAHRQPGSSFKPLSVYSQGIERGLISPISIIDDYPYKMLNGRVWPTNSGAASYQGRSTVLRGITDSVNTMAVRILADLVTPQASFEFLENKYHIDLDEENDIDVSPLAMGGLHLGVCTRDMAEAFATFPNNGVYASSRTYTKITQMIGDEEVLLLDNPSQPEPILKETTAYYMNYMLQNVIRAGTAAGQGNIPGMHAAGKTGTTNSMYDRWFVGYTPYYTAAVWTGYPANNERINSGSRNPALDLWQKVMARIHAGLPDKDFPDPGGRQNVAYCLDSGLLATEYCTMDPRGSRVASAAVFPGDVPTQVCNVHTAANCIRMCRTGGVTTTDEEGNSTTSEVVSYRAGEFCPEETVYTVCPPDFVREPVGGAVANDERYRYQHYGASVCPVHDGSEEPEDPGDTSGEPGDTSQDPGDTSQDPGDTSTPGGPSNPSGPGSTSAPGGTGTEEPPGTDLPVTPEPSGPTVQPIPPDTGPGEDGMVG